jgi:hypothetical protein
MHNPFLFFSDLVKQPLWVPVWVAILALANITSLFFWSEPVAKVIFITFLVSAVTLMAMYSYFGFEKILGIGHVFWIFLLPYILLYLVRIDGRFFLYLLTLSIFLTISLVFDAIDVWKFFHEKRA